jgi:hypothetical protein
LVRDALASKYAGCTDRAHELLETARENVTGGQWWSIVSAEILAREIEQRLQIATK